MENNTKTLPLEDSNTLRLTLKGKWFDMILSGEKLEEYREIKDYWFKRLVFQYKKVFRYSVGVGYDDGLYIEEGILHCCSPARRSMMGFNYFDTITFTHGYAKNARKMIVEFKGIDIGVARPEWSDNWQGDVFRIKLGNIIKTENI